MELSPTLYARLGFIFSDADELIRACGKLGADEVNEVGRLVSLGLPPVTSAKVLSVMFGYNLGFIHSMLLSPKTHYRQFVLPKGNSTRLIVAPKVALKVIQKWLSVRLQQRFQASDSVFGFVPGRSHIDAAQRHVGAKWVCSVDIKNFFPSVPIVRVEEAFAHLGYASEGSLSILPRLCCYRGYLVQGSPTSPLISNIVLRELDHALHEYATSRGLTFTRYADDIVVSGSADPPETILADLVNLVELDGWVPSERKSVLTELPNRLKVHGLLVHGPEVRLTKGYRNRIRAYRHLLKHEKVQDSDLNKLRGHVNYAVQVETNNTRE